MLRFALVALIGLSVSAFAEPVDSLPIAKPPLHICASPDLVAVDKPVLVEFRIGADGTVVELALAKSSGSAAADLAALGCVKNWTYEPAIKNGKPVDFIAKVLVQQNRLAQSDEWRPNVSVTNASPEIAKALDRLIRDVQFRCPALYDDVALDDYATSRARNRIVAHRFADGRIETKLVKSSPMLHADKNADVCVRYLIGKHDDLPPAFTVDIEINWALFYDY
jgi:TonB family protein